MICGFPLTTLAVTSTVSLRVLSPVPYVTSTGTLTSWPALPVVSGSFVSSTVFSFPSVVTAAFTLSTSGLFPSTTYIVPGVETFGVNLTTKFWLILSSVSVSESNTGSLSNGFSFTSYPIDLNTSRRAWIWFSGIVSPVLPLRSVILYLSANGVSVPSLSTETNFTVAFCSPAI